ncbi:MAG: carboxy terminal-processing peptidase [Steroidobacteraceae bacterium]
MTVTETSRRSRRSMGAIALSALLVLTLTGAGSTGAPAGSSAGLLPAGALAPAERQRLLARRIGVILEQAHYRRASIDDRMSEEIYKRYLESLDNQHSYFLASDIAEFDAYKQRFDDMIRTGDVEPAFAMYARLQQRNHERIDHALALLATEPDFSVDETFEFDRTKAAWPASKSELDELWRKRVKSDSLSLVLAGKTWEETSETLRKRYERVLKASEKVTADEVFENLMNAYARTFDPHSNYFSARNSEEYRIQMSLSYEGIGATLQTEDDYASIVNLLPGGPAAVAGTLGIKDRITGISQAKDGPFEDVIGWRLDDVVQKIRGKGGTLVRLQVLPAGAAPGTPEKVVELTRGKVTLEGQAAKKERRLITRNGKQLSIGVINVPSFYRDVDEESKGGEDYRSTTRDVARLIGELRKEGPLDGLILDLRGDGGGFLPEATALTGLFIDKGPVVQLKDYTGRVEVLDDPTAGTTYDGPLVVLIDRYSASASEIFAGAIQDYGRGYIVGQRSFGKGTVQNLIPLDRWTQKPVEGQLTVTIGKFYRVTGESTQHRGVEPDIPLPSSIPLDEVGESSLEAALPWDRIAAANFQRVNTGAAQPTAVALDRSEAARGKSDPDFRWLVDSIAVSEKLREQKTLSLNLAQRKAERESLDADRLRLENGRRKALGKSVFPTLTEMEASEEVSGDKAPDILLDRTTDVMGDIVAGIAAPLPPPPPRAIAQRETPQAAAKP